MPAQPGNKALLRNPARHDREHRASIAPALRSEDGLTVDRKMD